MLNHTDAIEEYKNLKILEEYNKRNNTSESLYTSHSEKEASCESCNNFIEPSDSFIVPDDPSYHKGGAIRKSLKKGHKVTKLKVRNITKKKKKEVYENILNDIVLPKNDNTANFPKEIVKNTSNDQNITPRPKNQMPEYDKNSVGPKASDTSKIVSDFPVTYDLSFNDENNQLSSSITLSNYSLEYNANFSEDSITD